MGFHRRPTLGSAEGRLRKPAYIATDMPFTFAHPAAVLPVLRLRKEVGWAEGLVAGSLAPDLFRPFFAFDREATHSLLGLFLLDVPGALLLAWIFHRFIHDRIRRLPGLASDAPRPGHFVIRMALAGALLGGLSHLGWDLFTHDHSPFTQGGILDRQIFLTPAGPFVVGQTLWYLNSVLGIAVLGVWMVRKIRRSPGGWRNLLSWSWARILLLPALPFTALFFGFHRGPNPFLKDLFIHIAYVTGHQAPKLLVPSALIAVGLLLWETRAPGPNRSHAPE